MVQTSFDFYMFLIRAGVATRLSSVLKGFFMIFYPRLMLLQAQLKTGLHGLTGGHGHQMQGGCW
jgi:hypothetical protein